MRLNEVCQFLNELAPVELAEEWDNVGLLVGDPDSTIERIMTCLTITPESAAEAIESQANLIVTHHPLPFRPLKKITTQRTATKLLWHLIQNGIAIYSPHTSFDSAENGINQSVCQMLGVPETQPLIPHATKNGSMGAGRFGTLDPPEDIQTFLSKIKSNYQLKHLRYVGRADAKVQNIASACGSGASFLAAASRVGCDTLITGEADFHTCLEASAQNVSLILLGHYASERFAVELLAERLDEAYEELQIWASKKESDPIHWC